VLGTLAGFCNQSAGSANHESHFSFAGSQPGRTSGPVNPTICLALGLPVKRDLRLGLAFVRNRNCKHSGDVRLKRPAPKDPFPGLVPEHGCTGIGVSLDDFPVLHLHSNPHISVDPESQGDTWIFRDGVGNGDFV
jgi:hypothetical protein